MTAASIVSADIDSILQHSLTAVSVVSVDGLLLVSLEAANVKAWSKNIIVE
jgi:hypothetical protein